MLNANTPDLGLKSEITYAGKRDFCLSSNTTHTGTHEPWITLVWTCNECDTWKMRTGNRDIILVTSLNPSVSF